MYVHVSFQLDLKDPRIPHKDSTISALDLDSINIIKVTGKSLDDANAEEMISMIFKSYVIPTFGFMTSFSYSTYAVQWSLNCGIENTCKVQGISVLFLVLF